MRTIILIILVASTMFAIGCRDTTAVEGKVNITSTKAFSNNKAMKSPPPQSPSQ